LPGIRFAAGVSDRHPLNRRRSDRRRRGPGLVDRLGLSLSASEVVDGLWVGALVSRPEPLLRRVREALHLIKTHDRLRYDRLTRDLKRIWVDPAVPPNASYRSRLDACMLNDRFVLDEDSTPELIAATIVHEATHARVYACGIGYEEKLRPRIEAICVRRELAFSNKLPRKLTVRTQALRALEASCGPRGLSNAALDQRQEDYVVEELLLLGVPYWLIRMARPVRRAIRGARRAIRRLRAAAG
jgi:hypothetical protein